jgi:hypothetical protein
VNFFPALTRKRFHRGSFHLLVDLQSAIKRYLAEHNAEPKPFVWKASALSILAKLDRLPIEHKAGGPVSALPAPNPRRPMSIQPRTPPTARLQAAKPPSVLSS